MLDIKFIRENKEKVVKGFEKRLFKDIDLIDKVLDLDEKRKKLLLEIEELRAKRNLIAKEKNIEEGKKIKEELDKKEPKLKEIEEKLKETLYKLPSVPMDDVPAGSEENKKLLRKVGNLKKFDFTPKDHLELGIKLGMIDIPRASKVSGSRFTYLKGDGVLLELALINFALEKLTKEGFIPVFPPMLIKKEITEGLGYWHGGGNENYYSVLDFEDDEKGQELSNPLYLIGTAEHSLVPMHKNELFEEKDLPKKYVAFSSCFRREAGTYGKDTKGILRMHQFDKVEMVCLTKPEDSPEMHEKLLSISEGLMKELGIPYQVVILAAGDIAYPLSKTYDIESFMPGQGKYRETHSISTATDYQSRRLNIKYKSKEGNKYAHILNGTVFAIGRTIIAIMENYQNKDGSITVPEVLRKWVGKDILK
ncbi:serine--tRNA ligase [Patescibacteria group bacterium]|nr:serine--tRNA ligase [Patescibacteria group bacterium]MBU2036181.1 serine--tRNA ligase [Patescibacteria group bacterium]